MKKFLAFATLVTVGASVLSAQNYFDDDIYYDASKSTEPATTKNNKPKAYNYNGGGTTVVTRTPTSTTITSIPGADTYTVITDNTRNVDEYNRRTGSVLVSSDTIGLSSEDPFYYTRRIARFDNPDVLDQLGDSAAYLYAASSPETQTVNVIVNNYETRYNGWDLCNPYWNYGWPGYYSPFYVGLSWSWGCGWNSWAWGPGYWGPGYWGPGYWGPGYWGPGYWGPDYWGPGWSWAGPSWGWGGHGYYNPRHPGAINRPGQGNFNHHRPGNVRPSGGTTRPGSGVRPGSGYGIGGRHQGAVTSGSGSRPGSGVRPGSGYGTNRGNRPANIYNGSGSGTRHGSGYTNSSTRHSSGNNVGSYNNGRYSSGGNRGSYSGGSRGGYSGGGGGSRGGGYSGGRGRH